MGLDRRWTSCGPAGTRRTFQTAAERVSSSSSICLESLPILLSDLVRVHPGRPAALPTAYGLGRGAAGPDHRAAAGALRVII